MNGLADPLSLQSPLPTNAMAQKFADSGLDHTRLVLSRWDKFVTAVAGREGQALEVDGASLDLAAVAAVARYEDQGQAP